MKHYTLPLLAVSTTLAISAICPSASAIELISLTSEGGAGDNESYDPAVSADGRFVVFTSYAALVPEDTELDNYDVYLKDRVTGEISILTVNSEGELGDRGSYEATISESGTHVAFRSRATNLVDDEDTNNASDIFVRELASGVITRVSVAPNGAQADGNSLGRPSLSGDGTSVTFASTATNFGFGETNGRSNIYVRQVDDPSSLVLISRNLSGNPGNAISEEAVISSDGDWVAFTSFATDLIDGPVRSGGEIFLCKRDGGQPMRVSLDSEGYSAYPHNPSISAKGDFVSYQESVNVYVYSVNDGSSSLVSVNASGEPGNDGADVSQQAISSTGRYVVFTSSASNLGGVVGSFSNAYRRDLMTGQTLCLTNTPDGAGPNWLIDEVAISADGNIVAFKSRADNLIRNDTNDRVDVFAVDVSELLRAANPIDNSAARAALQKKIRVLKKEAALAKRKKQAGKAKRLKKSIRRLTMQLQRW